MKTLLELSKTKLKAYRDEARLTDLPDRLLPDHATDERTEVEKTRRRKGIQNATDKIQKIHKDEAKAAKLARKSKPPKPKKPDSRIIPEQHMAKLEEGNKANKQKKNEYSIDVGSGQTGDTRDREESLKVGRYVDNPWHSRSEDQKPDRDRFSYREKENLKMRENAKTNEETEMEFTAEEILEHGPTALLGAVLSDDPNMDELFNTVMGAKIDTMLDMLKNELAAGMFAQEEEVEVTTEDFVAALEEAGVELTEEQIDELHKKTLGSYIVRASTDAANRAFGTGMHRERGSPTPSKEMLNGVTSKKEDKRHKGISSAVKKLTADTTDYLATLGIELTEEQTEMLEASLWKPVEAGFTKKGIAPKGGLRRKDGVYDKATHEKLSSPKMSDQLNTTSFKKK